MGEENSENKIVILPGFGDQGHFLPILTFLGEENSENKIVILPGFGDQDHFLPNVWVKARRSELISDGRLYINFIRKVNISNPSPKIYSNFIRLHKNLIISDTAILVEFCEIHSCSFLGNY